MTKQIVPFFALLMILCGLGWYVDSVAHRELTGAARLIIYTIAGTVITMSIAGTVIFVLILIERFRMMRAKRKVAQREAEVMVITAGHGEQVHIRETSHLATWRQAHLDSRVVVNGKATQPTEAEVRNWQIYNIPRIQTVTESQGLLPAVTQVDLMAALDSVQRCLIVGASDAGKTTLLQWLVSRRLNTSHVIVIDPHSYPGKYPACDVIGQGRNYAEIEKALNALVKLMTKRYDEIGRGVVAEMHHSRVTILIDEWRAITGNLGKPASEAIKALLTESRKAAFSVFVASHSDRAKPLGLEGEYDLKDGFAIVKLSVVNGVRTATLDTGNGEIQALLPGPFTGNAPQVIEHSNLLEYAEPEPDETERQVLDLAANGTSKSAIARKVFGGDGGNQLRKVSDILDRLAP